VTPRFKQLRSITFALVDQQLKLELVIDPHDPDDLAYLWRRMEDFASVSSKNNSFGQGQLEVLSIEDVVVEAPDFDRSATG
jgi:hypothetical protein